MPQFENSRFVSVVNNTTARIIHKMCLNPPDIFSSNRPAQACIPNNRS